MRKSLAFLICAILSTLLVACEGGAEEAKKELKENDTEKAEAKIRKDSEKSEDKKENKENDDIWTYYNAKWSDEFNGLKVEIQKVVVTDKAPTVEDEKAEESAVGVKFKVENTSDKVLSTYPDQAVLITSTGEQIDMPDMWLSDNIGGDIHEGVIKEGDVIWYLERGHAEDIEWVKVEFDASDDETDEYHTFTADIKLK